MSLIRGSLSRSLGITPHSLEAALPVNIILGAHEL